jgi:4-hydroxy-3-methylbut-2-enyl diphosphate reductase
MGRINGCVHLISTPEEVSRLKVADPDKLAFITQTTLSVDDTRAVIEALKARFPTIVGPDTKDICYATQNRQRAARELAKIVDVVLVVGAPNSSNSNRLREIAAESGVPAYLIEDARALDPSWIESAGAVGITAGASAPAELVEEVITRLRELAEVELSVLPGVTENVRFRMPTQLVDVDVAG